MTIAQARDREFLKKRIVGPWIFVDGSDPQKYDFYVPMADETIELLYQAHDWYSTKYRRDKEISEKSPAGFKLKWLQGLSEQATKIMRHSLTR